MSEFGMITEESSPKAPIMVIAFAGWNDAGGASTGQLEVFSKRLLQQKF